MLSRPGSDAETASALSLPYLRVALEPSVKRLPISSRLSYRSVQLTARTI
jgi:hypothetical protein